MVLFGGRRALLKNPELNISLEGERLQQVNCVKYLGVMLDNMSWNAHVVFSVAKFSFQLTFIIAVVYL